MEWWAQFSPSWSSHLNMKAFICSALLAVASARPQLLSHGLVGHGVVGHGVVGHGVVGHAVAHPVVANPVAHPVAHRVVAHPVVAHPVAHAVASYNPGDLAEPSPYNYQYAVADDYSGANFAQSEANDGTGAVSGSHSVNLPDGRIQHVNYEANDITGNVAEVTYTGEAQYPPAPAGGYVAAAPVVAHAVHAAPVVHAVHAAPVVAHAVHAAPVVAHATHGIVHAG